MELTHFDEKGQARMVDVGYKPDTERRARARGTVFMQPKTLKLVKEGSMAKGDVLGVARVAGIMAAKRTPELIPMCHPLPLNSITLDFHIDEERQAVEIEAAVKCSGKTGVEMDALVAVSVAGLTIYDMCKAIDKMMVIGEVRLVEKAGGKSGHFVREGEPDWDV